MRRSRLAVATSATCAVILSVCAGFVFERVISSPATMRLWTDAALESREVIGRRANRTEHGTLSFVLSTNCAYCDKSVEFYKALLGARSREKFNAIAVFEEPEETSLAYLRKHGLAFDDVYQVNFMELNIVGTPTLLLVNAEGEIIQKWEGMLSDGRKREVLEFLAARH